MSYPACSSAPDFTACVGQSAVADFDLDGRLDILFVHCGDGGACDDEGASGVYFATAKFLWEGVTPDFIKIPLRYDGEWMLDPSGADQGYPSPDVYYGLAPKVGDINLDGYPDLLIRMKNRRTGKRQMQVRRRETTSFRSALCQMSDFVRSC